MKEDRTCMTMNRTQFLAICAVSLLSFGCQKTNSVSSSAATESLQLLTDQPPQTLNPRRAADAAGQRIGALLFRALTQIDSDLNPVSDLARSWKTSADGRLWTFDLPDTFNDHAGQPITPERITRCLEQYRTGKPTSVQASSFPTWTETRVDVHQRKIIIVLSSPDPYLPRNISLLRFFQVQDESAPCTEPGANQIVIGSGVYRLEKWDLAPEQEFLLIPMAPPYKRAHVEIIRDEPARALKLLRGEVDAIQNGLTLSKSQWIRSEFADRFEVKSRNGVNVSYLALNNNDPVLKDQRVRKAIMYAIDRSTITETKLKPLNVANSFLSPSLPESAVGPFVYSPNRSISLLEEAGYKPGANGIRLHLKYKTTPVREGYETALIIKEMLRPVGIDLALEVVEPTVHLSQVKKGNFQLYSSRWIGVSDGSILYSTLRSKQPNNRVKYSNSQVDAWLDQAMKESDLTARKKLLTSVQRQMADDVPYLPLWFWTNDIIIKKELANKINSEKISLSGAWGPFLEMLSK